MVRTRLWGAARVLRPYRWPAAVAAVVALGWWGHERSAPERSHLGELYAAVRLFFVNLDVPDGSHPDWRLWVAAVLAPLLTATGLAALFRDRLQGLAAQFLARPEVVVVGAGERAAALVRAQGERRAHTAVVVDPDPQRLAPMRDLGAWTVVGDGVSARSLRRAAVARAAHVVILTGDDRRNCAVTAAVLAHTAGLRASPHVFVELAEAGLARTLERRDAAGEARATPFSGAGLAVADVLDDLGRPDGRLLRPENDEPPSFALFGSGPLLEAAVLELHQRRRVRLLRDGAAAGPRPRIALFGPDAEDRRAALAALLGTELDELGVAAFTVDLDQAAELDADTARRLLDFQPLREVMVLVGDDLQGAAIALALRRHLDAPVVLVTESPAGPFGTQLVAPRDAVRAYRVPALAYRLDRLTRHRTQERLARAFHECAPGARGAWDDLSPAERDGHRAEAETLLVGSDASPYVRVDTFHPIGPPEVPIAEALGATRPAALARAGLSLDLRRSRALVTAARRLLELGHPAAFEAWCEAARLEDDVGEIAGWDTDLVGRPWNADLEDVRRTLQLRRAALGDRQALGDPLTGSLWDWARGELVVVVGGSPADAPAELGGFLAPALHRPRYPGTVMAPPGDGGVARLLRAESGIAVRTPDGDGATPRRAHLRFWAEVLRAGREACATRLLALPGDEDARVQLVLARALGVTAAWLPIGGPADGRDLPRLLVGGAGGVVELPVDPMTVRAFLRPSTWGDQEVRHRLAAALHARYTERQRAVKKPGDPALRPFEELSPALRRSNLAVVDDIPAKLAAMSLRLCPLDEAPRPSGWPPGTDVALLAEMEHGRWNVERLLSGWSAGSRDPGRLLSPHLLPWSELPEEVRRWDRQMVEDLPLLLAGVGLGVSPR